jgi:hypothetical protein
MRACEPSRAMAWFSAKPESFSRKARMPLPGPSPGPAPGLPACSRRASPRRAPASAARPRDLPRPAAAPDAAPRASRVRAGTSRGPRLQQRQPRSARPQREQQASQQREDRDFGSARPPRRSASRASPAASRKLADLALDAPFLVAPLPAPASRISFSRNQAPCWCCSISWSTRLRSSISLRRYSPNIGGLAPGGGGDLLLAGRTAQNNSARPASRAAPARRTVVQQAMLLLLAGEVRRLRRCRAASARGPPAARGDRVLRSEPCSSRMAMESRDPQPWVVSFSSTASEMRPYPSRVQVVITRFTTS